MNTHNSISQSAFFIQTLNHSQNRAVTIKRLDQSQKILEILHRRLRLTLEAIASYTSIRVEDLSDLFFHEKRDISEATFKKLTYFYCFATKASTLPVCNRMGQS